MSNEKIKEAAEKYADITPITEGEAVREYFLIKKSFESGATSEAAGEYWREKLKSEIPGLRERFKEPIPMIAGSNEVLVNGKPLSVDFRIISEENYQKLFSPYLVGDEEMKFKKSDMISFAMACSLLSFQDRISIEEVVYQCFAKNYEHGKTTSELRKLWREGK